MLAELFSILGQTSEQIPSALSAGGTAAVMVFAYWRLSLSDKEKERLRDDNLRLQDELRAKDEKTLAMAEKAIPALVEASRIFGEVRASMDSPHRSLPGGAELERLTRRLERLTDEIQRDR